MDDTLDASPEKPRIPRARKEAKPRKVQLVQATICLVAVLAFGWFLSAGNVRLGLFWMFGILFGLVLQRARFCFTAAFRDPWLTGSTSLTRAALVAFGLGIVGVAALKFAASGGPGNFNMAGVTPIGVPLLLGSFMFGTGMVLAGGCASGTLMRVGEGFMQNVISLIFFVIGVMLAAKDIDFWRGFYKGMPAVFLPDAFGWFGALVVQGLIILLLYVAAVKWEEKKMGRRDS